MRLTGETYGMISVDTIAELGRAAPDEAERWIADPTFPRPVARSLTGDLYDRRAVQRWLLEHGRRGLEMPPAP